MSDSDDEFDELFSFSTPVNPTKPTTSSSPINFDLNDDSGITSTSQLDQVASSSAANTGSASNSKGSSDTTGSYYKVSPTTTDTTSTPALGNNIDDDDDDIFGEFNLVMDNTTDKKEDAANIMSSLHNEDDFHAMDADTREFLDFLEEPTKSTSSMPVTAANILDDDSDDGVMDFVDIDGPSDNIASVLALTTELDTATPVKPALSVESSEKDSTAEMVQQMSSIDLMDDGEEDTQTFSSSFQEISMERKESVDKNSMEMPVPVKVPTPPRSSPKLPPLSPQSSPAKSVSSTSMSASPKQLSKPSTSPRRQVSTSSVQSNPYQPNSILAEMDEEEEIVNKSSTVDDDTTPAIENVETIVPQITFDSLADAIRSPQSSMKDVNQFLYPHGSKTIEKVTNEDRLHLWCKAICSKTYDDVQSSSLADSFTSWDETFDYDAFQEGVENNNLEQDFVHRLMEEVEAFTKRVLGSESVIMTESGEISRILTSMLVFYYRSNVVTVEDDTNMNDLSREEKAAGLDDSLVLEEDVTENVPMELGDENKNNTITEGEEKEKKKTHVEWNTLIAPIAATLLASGVDAAVASVMLSQIIPTSMPLVSLTKNERLHGARTLHQQLYFLVCYHFPLLVLHLDRCAPGWHWPSTSDDAKADSSVADGETATEKSRNLESRGVIPISWFSSYLAGEGVDSTLDINKLLPLWDIMLTTNDRSLNFFLALSLLERNSNNLLMLKGQELIDQLKALMSFSANDVEVESFPGNKSNLSEGQEFISVWTSNAYSLRDSTPYSIVESLGKTEDEAITKALELRSKLAMEKVAAELAVEAEAHRVAVEKENARKLEERMQKYYKEKLEKFYSKHCPEKLDSVDRILEIYKDRYQLLDSKLQQKYGRGFLPLISVFNPKVTSQPAQIVSSVEIRRKKIAAARAEERAKGSADGLQEAKKKHQVAITVEASEIMPVVCANKKAQMSSSFPLRFYLVDSRPEEAQKTQGGFPTAARLSPQDLMDPERIQKMVDMFEALRGAVHIVVMGEGFSALPSIYDHPLNKSERKLFENDESRTNMCALFFIKKGFPFVSVLEGGFAAAHAWLARHNTSGKPMTEYLVDYDEESSPFADLERSYQEQQEFKSAPTSKKTAMAMQKFLDSSMVRLSAAENRIENFTHNVIESRKEAAEKSRAEKNAGLISPTSSKDKEDNDENDGEDTTEMKSIKSTFANIRNKLKDKEDRNTEHKSFDLGKISFGRKPKQENDDKEKSFELSGFKKAFSRPKLASRNPFKKNENKEDDALEKEIDASLSNPKKNVNVDVGQDSEEKKFSFTKIKKFSMSKSSSGDSALREEESMIFNNDD